MVRADWLSGLGGLGEGLGGLSEGVRGLVEVVSETG